MVQNRFFPEINGNFAFGCMRLPLKVSGEVDLNEFTAMVDAFLDAGFNYFDTAHGYIRGLSEKAIKECLSRRYDRSKFLLTNKLSDGFFEKEEDIRPLFMSQLEACGVDYFDFYLMHAQDKTKNEKYTRLKAYETVAALKKEGYVRHMGISFHDKAEVLDMILKKHPEIEVVQIQFNYADYEDASVESRKVYEVCVKHDKPVFVMEPVKGGSLVNLPPQADKILRSLGIASNASYAIRFAASFDNVSAVLSGMSNMAQMEDNVKTMGDFKPLSERERKAIANVCAVLKDRNLIPCTACRYCVEENRCPQNILIPDLFAALNSYEAFKTHNSVYYYKTVLTKTNGKASDCIMCGGCERLCPQHLPIRRLLARVAETFEK